MAFCKICKTRSTKNIKMYTVPKNIEKRQLWNMVCDVNFTKHAKICEKHFCEDDFVHKGTKILRRYLKSEAVPRLLFKGKHRDYGKAGEDEVEELFDGTITTLTDDSNTKANDKSMESTVNDAVNLNFATKSVQTGCSAENTRACGLVEVTKDNESFTLNCFYCDEVFSMLDCLIFVEHIKDKHTALEQNFLQNEEHVHPRPKVEATMSENNNREANPMTCAKLDSTKNLKNQRTRLHMTPKQQITHMASVHSEDPAKVCDMCGKQFLTRSGCRTHKLQHAAPQFKCTLCSRTFWRNYRLIDHMKLHRNERDWICDLCGRKFLRKQGLTEHKKVAHMDKKAYPCTICNRQYADYMGLSHHRKRVHVPLEGTIDELERLYEKQYDRHQYVVDPVTSTKRLVCDICGKTYQFHGGLRTHKINAHGFANRAGVVKEKIMPKREKVEITEVLILNTNFEIEPSHEMLAMHNVI